jgi:hypothetical protein
MKCLEDTKVKLSKMIVLNSKNQQGFKSQLIRY